MNYNLTIGEAVVVVDWDEFGIVVSAKKEHHDIAPAFGEPTDYSNQRWPSYTAWEDFL